MADEVLINRLYDIVDEITRLGGEQERTSIVPGVLVANANPSDLPTGYIKIVSPEDGDYVPCLTINGLVVADNDLLNVLFTKGTEPVALSQSSQSPSNSLKVSEIWESDFGAVALEADADGNLTLNGARTLTIPTDLIHAGDADTKLSFADDQISFDAGAVTLFRLTETTQNLVEIGDVAGGGDVDININSGNMFIEGATGQLGIGTTTIPHGGIGGGLIAIEGANADASVGPHIQFTTSSDDYPLIQYLNFAHNNIQWQFDAYFDGAQKSSDSGSNFRLVKANNRFRCEYASGNAQGASFSWSDGWSLTTSGYLGVGIAIGQGKIHAYDTVSGFLLWEYDGLDATVRSIIPNGTGDVLYRLHADYVLRDSAGAVASGSTDVSNTASVNLTVGTNTVRLRVNANGSCDTNRTAGTDTIKVAYTLRWL